MGGENDVAGVPQRIVLGQRLRVHHVQGGACQLSAVQGLRQGLLVQSGTTAHVDDAGVGGQQGDPLPVQDVNGLRRAGQGHHQDFCAGQHVVQSGDGIHLVEGGVGLSAAAETHDLRGPHAPQPVRHMASDIPGAQDGEFVVPDGADGQLIGPAVAPDDFDVIRHPPQQHQGHHHHMLGDGNAVDVGVGQQAVRVGEQAGVLAVEVHPGKGAAVPLQRSGSGAQKVSGMGVQNLAVLEAVLRLLKLVQVEEMGGEARPAGGLPDLVLVGFREEFLIDADIAIHKQSDSF